MRSWTLAIALAAIALVACQHSQPNPSASDAGKVVDAFIAARDARDLDATMASFGDSPELRSSQGINWSGRDAVRAIMAYRIQDTYIVGERHVSGDTVTWAEHVRRSIASGSPPANFDEQVEATVTGGRIQSLVTYLGARRAQVTSDTATTEPVSPAASLLLPASIVLLVLAVMVWPAGSGAPHRASSGRLLVELRRYAESHATQGRQNRS